MPIATPEVPTNWIGSKPEFYIYWALTQIGLLEHRDFTYQSPQMGGRLQLGGAVVDFLLPGYGLAINVHSIYWHYATVATRVHDQIQRATLEGHGLKMIYIDEEDALRNPIFYVREALKGNDFSRMGGM